MCRSANPLSEAHEADATVVETPTKRSRGDRKSLGNEFIQDKKKRHEVFRRHMIGASPNQRSGGLEKSLEALKKWTNCEVGAPVACVHL